MITHIVLFAFNDTNKEKHLHDAKALLEALPNEIDELKSLEVGINITHSERAFDLSLHTTFDTLDDLHTYATHPQHLDVVAFLRSVTHKSHVVDYES